MDSGPLVSQEIDAGKSLIEKFNDVSPIAAAFWLKAVDDEQRYLYVAPQELDPKEMGSAYGKIFEISQSSPSPFLDPFRVKLISAKNPLAQAALDVHQRYPAPIATRFGGKHFGGVVVDDLYIYPPLVHASSP